MIEIKKVYISTLPPIDFEVTPELIDAAMSRIVGESKWREHKEMLATMKRWDEEMRAEREELMRLLGFTSERVDEAWAATGNLSWNAFYRQAIAQASASAEGRASALTVERKE